MKFHQDELAPSLVERALSAPMGRACLARVQDSLVNDLERNRFTCARAVKAFTRSLDEAVWTYLQNSSLRPIVYRNYLSDFARSQKGKHLADAFVQETGASDQRPRLRFLTFT
jgi:hypothetical protein